MAAKWYEYLTAVYPPRGDDTARRAAYLATFADEDQAQMLEVAKASALASKWMPTVQELTQLLRVMKEARERDEDAGWVLWARREKQRRAWGAEWLTWTECVDGCGERYPSFMTGCPFCADLAEMAVAIEQHVEMAQ